MQMEKVFKIIKQLLIHIRVYSLWFMMNLGFCLLPILILYLIRDELSNMVPSILSYCYTLVITSYYLFDRFSNPNSVLKNGALLYGMILLVAFVFYPNLISKEHLVMITASLPTTLGITVSIALLFSFLMNYPDLIKEVDRELSMKKFNEARNSGTSIDDFVQEKNKSHAQ